MKDVRLFFRKNGDLKYISHLDMNRSFIRLLRKSGLNVWYTEGFNPHPYITFALPLSLGFESNCEAVDFKLLDDTDYETVTKTLKSIAPNGIEILRAAEPKFKAGKIAYAVYELNFHEKEHAKMFLEFLNADTIIVSKKTKSGAIKVSDIKDKFEFSQQNELTFSLKLPCGNENINPQSVVNSFCEQKNIQTYVSYKRTNLLTADDISFE